MAKKRKTTDADYQRLAENLLIKKDRQRHIEDYEAYSKAYDHYMKGSGNESNATLKQEVWKAVKAKRNIREERIPETKQQLTKSQVEHFPKAKKQREEAFKYLGRSSGRTQFVREIKTRAGIRYITKKGRYASLLKK